MKNLTQLQTAVLHFMLLFFEQNDQLPPAHKIASEFGRHLNQIVEMLQSFEKKGLIERNEVGKFKFSRVNTYLIEFNLRRKSFENQFIGSTNRSD